jgi:hypothetical protein
MAGDWMKVEKATPDKPEIRHIARSCRVSIDKAFSAWFRLWCWLDSETETGDVRHLTPADCDDIGRLPGLGAALACDVQGCGWIRFHAAGATVINWDRHNGQSAKRRAQDMDRKRRVRMQSGQDADEMRTREE